MDPAEAKLPFRISTGAEANKALKGDHSIKGLLQTSKAVHVMGDTGAGYDVLLHKTQQSSSARSKSPSPKAGTSQRMAPGADTLPFDGDRPTVTFSALSTDPASQASGEPESAGEAASPRQQEKKAPSPKRAPSAQQAHRKGLLGKQTGARKRAALTLAPEKFSFVEEGKNVRAGRKAAVNCWTVITVNGKEFVVEKEFKTASGTGHDGSRPGTSSGAYADGLNRGFRAKAESNPARPAPGKVRCDLCLLFFSRDSINGVISFKRILDLRRKWGLELRGRRSTAASYIYSEARLCLFCSQLFHVSDRDTCDDSKQKPPVENSDNIQFASSSSNSETATAADTFKRTTTDLSKTARSKTLGGTSSKLEVPDRDVALGKPVVTSSVADGCSGKMAVSGVWKTGPNVDECCKTFTEFDPWLEIDLLALYYLRSVRILHRVERRGDPRVYRMTPFWVMVSKTPILAHDVHEARKLSVHAVKIVKAEKVTSIELPSLLGTVRYVRVQVEGPRPLQLCAVQVLKGEMPPSVTPTVRSPVRERQSGPVSGLALLFANIQERAAAAAAANGCNTSVVPDDPLVRPHTTAGTVSVPGAVDTDLNEEFSPSISFKVRRRPHQLEHGQHRRPATAAKVFTRDMANSRVENVVTETLRRYQIQEEFEARLARSKTPFTEAELQPLTELFLSVANEAGYPKSTPLEYMKIQTASIVASIASLRARNTALKELLGEGSSLEALAEAIDNVCRIRQAVRGTVVKTLPADYPQFLELVACLRQGKVTLAEVSRIFASFIMKRRRDYTGEEARTQRKKDAKPDEEELRLISKDKQELFHRLQCYLNLRHGFLKRYEKKVIEQDAKGVQCKMDWLSNSDSRVDWARVHDERREHQEQMRLAAPPPDITPRLPHKTCAVCLFQFPGDALIESVTVKSLANLFTRLNLPPDKYTTRLDFGMNKFYRIPICVFCNQLFDPDEEDGVAKSKCERQRIGYISFFDDRYPDRYSMSDPTVRKKYSAGALVKQAAALLPGVHPHHT